MLEAPTKLEPKQPHARPPPAPLLVVRPTHPEKVDEASVGRCGDLCAGMPGVSNRRRGGESYARAAGKSRLLFLPTPLASTRSRVTSQRGPAGITTSRARRGRGC